MAFFKSLFKKEEPAPVTLSEDFPDLYNEIGRAHV